MKLSDGALAFTDEAKQVAVMLKISKVQKYEF